MAERAILFRDDEGRAIQPPLDGNALLAEVVALRAEVERLTAQLAAAQQTYTRTRVGEVEVTTFGDPYRRFIQTYANGSYTVADAGPGSFGSGYFGSS